MAEGERGFAVVEGQGEGGADVGKSGGAGVAVSTVHNLKINAVCPS